MKAKGWVVAMRITGVNFFSEVNRKPLLKKKNREKMVDKKRIYELSVFLALLEIMTLHLFHLMCFIMGYH